MAGADGSGGGSRRYATSAGYTASQEETPTKDAYGVTRTILSGLTHGGGGGGGGGRGHMCTYCGREFRSRSNLSRHVRDHHTSHDPSTALCPVCGKNCRNRSNVLTHMYRVHHVTARQLDAFTHPFALPQPPPPPPPPAASTTRSDAHSTNAHQHPTAPATLSSSSADRSQDLAPSVQTQGVQAYGTNTQSPTHEQQQHMSYGYSMQDTTAHHAPHHHQHHHHQHHHPHHHQHQHQHQHHSQNPLQDNA